MLPIMKSGLILCPSITANAEATNSLCNASHVLCGFDFNSFNGILLVDLISSSSMIPKPYKLPIPPSPIQAILISLNVNQYLTSSLNSLKHVVAYFTNISITFLFENPPYVVTMFHGIS